MVGLIHQRRIKGLKMVETLVSQHQFLFALFNFFLSKLTK